jgi:hypothetical protein
MRQRGATSIGVSVIGGVLALLACSSSAPGKSPGAAGSIGATGAAGQAAAGNGAAGAPCGPSVGATTAVAGVVDTSQSVLTRNKHETRDGFFIQPTLTKAMAAKMAPDTTFNAKFTGGQYWGAPLYVENGPGNKGTFIAATSDNNVYALDETTGANLWPPHAIGPAPAKTGVPCGNVAPVGITSTPVIDATARTIYVAGAVGDANGIMRHEVHALALDTGLERPNWPVNVSALKGPNNEVFNSQPQNQRSALSLVNGTLYVAYGGHDGDCGTYHGWVIAINAANPTKTGTWVTGGVGEAIWAGGGMASDGNGVIAVTGNNLNAGATHLDSEEVVRVTGMGAVDRTTGIFFPGTWRTMDSTDADFGSSSPVALTVPASKPSSVIAAATKNGHFYLLNAASFGGMDKQLVDLVIAPTNKVSIWAALAAYTSTTGLHVVLNAGNTASFCPACTKATGTISVLVTPGTPPSAKVAWCAGGGSASPIATSTDGKNETVVWFYDGGLVGVDGDTGASIYSGGSCPGVRQWSSPIAVKGRIIVGGDSGLCSWSVH